MQAAVGFVTEALRSCGRWGKGREGAGEGGASLHTAAFQGGQRPSPVGGATPQGNADRLGAKFSKVGGAFMVSETDKILAPK